MDRKCGKTYVLRYLHFKLWSLITFFWWVAAFCKSCIIMGAYLPYNISIGHFDELSQTFRFLCVHEHTSALRPTCRHCTVPSLPYLLHAPLDWSKEPPRATWLVEGNKVLLNKVSPPIAGSVCPGRCPSNRPAQLEENNSYSLVSISSDFTRNVFVCDFSEHIWY